MDLTICARPGSSGEQKTGLTPPSYSATRWWSRYEVIMTHLDSMDPFVIATYYLEGDGPLSLSAYECVRSLYAHITVRDFKNTNAVARQLAGGNLRHEQQL